MSRRSGTLAVLAAVLLLSSSCVNRFGTGVTCEGVRQLALGMSTNDVRALIGDPIWVSPGNECGIKDLPGECWDFVDDGWLPASTRLIVEFDRSGLSKVSAYYKYLTSDRDTRLYDLSRAYGPKEGPEFTKYIPCRGA